MALSDDLINFDLIEEHKENIQSLPSGRSAKQLASILSPKPSAGAKEVTLEETKTLNEAIRKEYEIELQSIGESDDPLDIYDRYVKWTLNAYPSAQSTPQSQLLPLLERATKAFLTSADYKNDPRYLKLWLHYIRLFSDTPRETFAFLARHSIGEHLALFYEEFASWLEGAGRWNQADEVYKLGMEREARPAERLLRKYQQFQLRYTARPQSDQEPSSPALPRVRAALAAKIDPFAPAAPTGESQPASRPASGGTNKAKKPKMAVFSDADATAPPPGPSVTNGWDSIGSMKERRKENTIDALPWVGQTLKAGKKVGEASKMEVFRDPNESSKSRSSRQPPPVVNPRTGRSERVFVQMDVVYADDGEEFSFEELRAQSRGWADVDWKTHATVMMKENANSKPASQKYQAKEPEDVENTTNTSDQNLDLTEPTQSQDLSQADKTHKPKKIKVREVKQETQTVKLRGDSPSKPKPRRKASAEPTMTFHSKAAHQDIYEMYNHASKPDEKDDTQSGIETDFDDDTVSTTGRMSTTNSELGEETVSSVRSFGADDTSASPWSDFTTGKISKVLKKARSAKHKRPAGDEHTGDMSADQTQSQDGFDTQAIAAIANQDFGELDTIAIAKIAAGGVEAELPATGDLPREEADDLETPVEEARTDSVEEIAPPRYVPMPPEDYEPTPVRPYRDPELAAQNKLPFMTPIVERTESSLAACTVYQNHFANTAPKESESPSKLKADTLLLDSPRPRSVTRKNNEEAGGDHEHSPQKDVTHSPAKANQKVLFAGSKSTFATEKSQDDGIFKNRPDASTLVQGVRKVDRPVHKGPIIHDLQCNPCDESVIDQILTTVYPAPASYPGFFAHSDQTFNHFPQIKAFARKTSKQNPKSSPRKTLSDSTRAMAPTLKFEGTSRVYAVKRELGEGAFAPVYLVESAEKDDADTPNQSERGSVEALKAEQEPKTLQWEFHILHLLKSRLGRSSRAMQSIVLAHECHLYRDECYLVLEYHSHGTLLDLVNQCRQENVRAGKTADGLEEPVAMWLGVELLRTVEAMHQVGILHGDLKADNCLVRFDPEAELTSTYQRSGENGWARKGLTLIDLGRGIDTRAFKPDARFIADWKAEETDCPEIREAKPWKWEIDLFGAAGVMHSLLFGKYIETVSVGGGGLGQKKEWKIREPFKRYWEKDIWTDVFTVLINGSGKNGDAVRKDLQCIRGMMEDWLEKEGERNGRDLRASIRRCERLVGMGGVSKAKR